MLLPVTIPIIIYYRIKNSVDKTTPQGEFEGFYVVLTFFTIGIISCMLTSGNYSIISISGAIICLIGFISFVRFTYILSKSEQKEEYRPWPIVEYFWFCKNVCFLPNNTTLPHDKYGTCVKHKSKSKEEKLASMDASVAEDMCSTNLIEVELIESFIEDVDRYEQLEI